MIRKIGNQLWKVFYLFIILAICMQGFAPVQLAQAATCTVTNDDDSGAGTLRALLADITCDTIDFGENYIIRLASEVEITREVTIDGANRTVSISGDTDNNGSNDVRLFSVASGATLTLRNLTLKNVDILLQNLTVADGVNNLTYGNGAGIYFRGGNYHTLTLTNMTFSGNRGGLGGAIFTEDSLVVTNVTFVGNEATYGAAIYVDGLYLDITITNSTFKDNLGTAAGIFYGGVVEGEVTLTINNSILANGEEGISSNCSMNLWNAIQGSHNLADDFTCNGIPWNIDIDEAWYPYLPPEEQYPHISLLGDLGDNGGTTQTVPLLEGSPAIDAGDDTLCPATDQREVTRPQGAACDIGSYEFAVVIQDTATSLTSSQNPVDQNVPFTLTAIVSPTPDDGMVAFKDEGVVITGCEAQAVTAGQATCTTAMESGTHSITAQYSGYGSYQPSLSPVYSQEVTTSSPDLTPPVITPDIQGVLGQNGWYTSDVSITWSVADSQSTVTSMTGCDPISITNDQPATSYTCTAASSGGTANVTVSIQRDAAAPALNPVVTPDPVLLNGSAVANPNATDTVSGLASATCDSVDSSSVGLHTVACSATDNAGNTASASASFTVVTPINYLISGTVYDDLNANGSRDAGEEGIGGAIVILALSLDQIPFNYLTAYSTADGSFQFNLTSPAGGLPAGFSVSVFIELVTGYKITQLPAPFAVLTGNLTGMDIGVHTIVLTPTPAGFPDGVQGVAYNQMITVTGGDAPYTFTPSSLDLPAGLAYAFDEQLGTITLSGTPTESGEFLAHIDFTDANTVFAQVHEYFTIQPEMQFSPATLPNGSLGTAYSQTITVSGGMPPYAFVVGSEQWLPAGLTLDTSSGSIVISGTPSEAGQATIDVYVSDQSGTTIEVQRAFWIKTDPSLTLTSSLNPSLEGQLVTFSLGSTATVADWPAPWGQVTFKADGIVIPGCDDLWLEFNPSTEEPAPNPVTCTVSSLAVGTHTITAELSALYGPYTDGSAELHGGQVVNAALPLYQSIGFTAPVDVGGVLNIAKAGQMIPLRWRLLDGAGNPVTDLDPASVMLSTQFFSCEAGTPTDTIETYTSGTTLLQNLDNGYYQLNWKTLKSYVNTCLQLTLTIDSWTDVGLTALFKFPK